MRLILRRETFIALRARRHAHQIASEMINPELSLEELRVAPQPPRVVESTVVPYLERPPSTPPREPLNRMDYLMILEAIALAAAMIGCLFLLLKSK